MRVSFPFLACIFLALPCFVCARGGVLGDDYADEENVDYERLPKLRISAETGFSRWLAFPDTSYTKDGDAFLNDLRSGWDFSLDAMYFMLPRGGVGLTWIWYLSKAEDPNVVFFRDGVSHAMKERASFVYVGPSFWSRARMGRSDFLIGGFGAGYLDLVDAWTDNGLSNRVEAQNFALVASVGWDHQVHPLAGLGVSGRFFFSNVTEYTYNGKKVRIEQSDAYLFYNVPLYRLELNLGLRFLL